jgi:hypothetical protein
MSISSVMSHSPPEEVVMVAQRLRLRLLKPRR